MPFEGPSETNVDTSLKLSLRLPLWEDSHLLYSVGIVTQLTTKKKSFKYIKKYGIIKINPHIKDKS